MNNNLNTKVAASILNRLIAICKDGVEGYALAEKEAKSDGLKTLLQTYVEQRAEFAQVLQAKVKDLGWDTEKGGSNAGALHRTWMTMKSAITHSDDAAILAECETGEIAALEGYATALKERDLPHHVRSLIQHQHDIIVSGRNSMSVLHDLRAA